MSNQLLSERMRELLPTREDWNDVVAEIAALEADLMGLRDALSLAEDRLFHTEQERNRLQERCARWKMAAKVLKVPNLLFDNADDAIAWLEGGDDE